MKKGLQPSALCAVGGFVVGSAALRIVLDRMTAIPVIKKFQGSELASTNSSAVSTESTDIDSDSYDPDPETMYDWAYEEEVNFTSAELSNDSFGLSAVAEDEEESLPAGIRVSRRTNLFTDDDGFRLKLFWMNGYYWQESRAETWWCMSCGQDGDGECKKDDMIYLVNCKLKSNADARFEAIKQKRGHQYRVVDTDLCLQQIGRSRRIALKQCSKKQLLQQFKSSRGKHGGFDLRPARYRGRCLTNHHHPKAGEVIYAESCKKAHRTKTGYWDKY